MFIMQLTSVVLTPFSTQIKQRHWARNIPKPKQKNGTTPNTVIYSLCTCLPLLLSVRVQLIVVRQSLHSDSLRPHVCYKTTWHLARTHRGCTTTLHFFCAQKTTHPFTRHRWLLTKSPARTAGIHILVRQKIFWSASANPRTAFGTSIIYLWLQ